MTRAVALFLPLLIAAGTARAQEMPAPPTPGPEHELFKTDEGTWDATVEISPGPDAPAMTSKGVETNTLGCNGLCLISDFKGDMGGMPFTGHGLSVYDRSKKKYVGSWSDSMSGTLAVSESTYDPATKTSTGWMESPDPATGAPMKTKAVVEYPDHDRRVFTMFMVGPDGKETQTMRITYVRRK